MSESSLEPQGDVEQELDGTVAQEPADAELTDAVESSAETEGAGADAPESAAEEAPESADEEDSSEASEGDAAAPASEDEDPAEAFKAELRAQEGDWYVIHSYAGYENRVKANLENRITSLNMEDYIFQIEVPMEEVVEIKNGQRKQVRRVRIPGYVLVRMDLTDESWGAVRHTPGVTGFVGNAYNPTPLRLDEVFAMLAPVFEAQQSQASAEGNRGSAAVPVEVEFEVGESVLVKEGSFEGHPATITEIKPDSQKLVVLLSIFERDVPVELGFHQVAKI